MIKSKISLTDAAEQRGSHVYWNRASKQIEQEQEGESVRLGLKFNNGIPKTTFIMYILGTAFGRSGDSRLAQIMVGCLSLRGAEKCGRHLDAASSHRLQRHSVKRCGSTCILLRLDLPFMIN
jgi:hypothetical protein